MEESVTRDEGTLAGTVVFKMSGSGNDFVFVDGRAAPIDLWHADRIRRICHRQMGVGADGLIVLEPGSGPGTVRYHFFNRDGLRAGLCGNGALCATRLAAWLELGSADGLVLETDAGPVRGRCLDGPGERAEIQVPRPSALTSPRDIVLGMGEATLHFTIVGVPHLVIQVDDLERYDLMERGRELRSHPALGSDGANVNFVAAAGTDGWAMRTFERGVEAETLACGTGAVATAAALAASGSGHLPIALHTRSGAVLTVSDTDGRNGDLQAPTLAGEGRLVYRAILGSIE
jgi:diaminopimelate epimerase